LKKIKTIHYYLTLSITAVILTLIMILIKPNTTNTNIFTEKLLVIAAFFTSCIFGISLTIYPNWWKKNKKNTRYNPNLKNQKTKRSFKGHPLSSINRERCENDRSREQDHLHSRYKS